MALFGFGKKKKEEEARAKAEAEAKARAAEEKAKEEARKKAEAEAKAKAEAERKAKEEAEKARIEAEVKAKVEAEFEAREKAEAMARAKAEFEAKAKATTEGIPTSVQIEKLEHNMVKLTIEVDADKFIIAMKEAYKQIKGNIKVPGFRRGKVPMAYLERQYGPIMFYEEAANIVINNEYPAAVTTFGLEVVSQPEIDVVQMEKGKNFIFTAMVALKPDVTLGQYKGIEIKKIVVEDVTEEEIAVELAKEQEKAVRDISVEARTAADGDIVDIDFAGTLNGVPFEGGIAEGQRLEIGSHSFVEGFEDQIIGHNIGDKFDVNVTFPEKYHAQELAGKPAVFNVKLNGIWVKELPVLNDEFAQAVSGFDTLDEMKADIKAKLTEKKEASAKTAKENAVVDKIVENAEMDIPEPMIETEVDLMAEDLSHKMQYEGLALEQYLQYMGMTREQFIEDLRPKARKTIQTRLVLEEIVKAENLEATEDELDAEINSLAEQSHLEPEQVRQMMAGLLDSLKNDIAVQKAITLVTNEAKEI